ncbi:hypothetical protein TWF696_007645 [Orbilia brochopaga]|uniref:Uncharacterized protein n=1 Tax=Orbilia brochopaga TaxID=3140254 RepID=A0AAV9UPG9_9PEZI
MDDYRSKVGSRKTPDGLASGKHFSRKRARLEKRCLVNQEKRKGVVAEMRQDNTKPEYEEDEAEEYRRLGELIGNDMPENFFDLETDRSKFNLNPIQEDIVDRVIYYPGCENTFKMAREYMDQNPEVRAVSNPEGPWMEEAEEPFDDS